MVAGVGAEACQPVERWDGRFAVQASPQGEVFERELVRAAAGVGEGESRTLAALSVAVAGPALAAVPPAGLRVSMPAGTANHASG